MWSSVCRCLILLALDRDSHGICIPDLLHTYIHTYISIHPYIHTYIHSFSRKRDWAISTELLSSRKPPNLRGISRTKSENSKTQCEAILQLRTLCFRVRVWGEGEWEWERERVSDSAAGSASFIHPSLSSSSSSSILSYHGISFLFSPFSIPEASLCCTSEWRQLFASIPSLSCVFFVFIFIIPVLFVWSVTMVSRYMSVSDDASLL